MSIDAVRIERLIVILNPLLKVFRGRFQALLPSLTIAGTFGIAKFDTVGRG
jgi:hypothetical protein